MGIATSPLHSSKGYDYSLSQVLNKKKLLNSMSQEYHTGGVFSFLNGFERSQQEQQQPQIRRDKLRVQGFEAALPLVGIEEEESGGINPVYETAGMLSEMFNFPPGEVTTATELLENQISQSYRNTRPSPLAGAAASGDWFLNRQGMVVGGGLDPLVHSKNQTVVNDTAHHHHHHLQQQQQQQQISSINADSAAVMQLFLMNPQQQRSPSPSSSHPPTSSTLHMLLPNPSPSSSTTLHEFHRTAPGGPEGSFGTSWVPNSGNETNPIEIPGLVEGQGLSLSLSSSLQHLEAAKAEELRMGGDGTGMLYFGQGGGSAPPQYQFKNMTATPGGIGGGVFHLQSGVGHNHQLQVGLGSSIGAFNMLRNSKYAKAAQELLEEFCSVGRGQFKKNKFSSKQNNNSNPSPNPPAGAAGAGGGNSSSTSKDVPPLSTSDRLEHQRRKVKLLSMLDEVDRRYNHYCDQMQMVVNSFDMVMGFGAAVSYTSLAQKAMSRHFRCLKEAVSAQLKHSCEVLGEKDAGSSGITKGETPRLRILEQSLRQQRAFHQMGMMEQEAWRPQRGLPERSVNILRAWLFEHFLHPYPSDADKHLLARQTGLSRNQVSNWFINARVRLWKPMVEDMYQQESKDGTQDQDQDQTNNNAQTPTPNPTGNGTATTTTSVETPTTTSSAITPPGKVSEFNALESDPSFFTINDQCSSENQATLQQNNSVPLPSVTIISSSSPSGQSFPVVHNPDTCRRGGPADYPATSHHHSTNADIESKLIRFGASTGDVSLTLGLRHAGNLPEKRQFSVRDFGGC